MNKTSNEMTAAHINELLTNLYQALPKNHQESNEIGGDFNIFHILGVASREVIVCRFLGYLLEPTESHKMHERPLLTFVKNVLGVQDFTEADAKASKVILEETIDQGRRVDIVIYSPKGVFPIEVKIWAGDQDAQLRDYFEYFHNYYGTKKIYYLTPSGWMPSNKSRQNLEDSQICCIRFSKEISSWLEQISKNENLPSNVKTYIEQFREVIYSMCQESEELIVIKEVLGLDNKPFHISENLTSAIKLLSHKDAIKNAIMTSYLNERLTFDKDVYKLDNCKDDDYKEINDKHALLKVTLKINSKVIAWICVDTNLYLVAKKVKHPSDYAIWHRSSVAERNYFWQYISPGKGLGHKFPLSHLNNFPEEDINISQCLNDIMYES